MKKSTFVITARGSHPTATPYEMDVEVSAKTISIDGIKLSWNDARTAFEVHEQILKAHRSLFRRGR